VTTPDPTTGRLAATRRPRVAAVLCACLVGAAAMPAFAQQTPAAVDLRHASVVLDETSLDMPAANQPAANQPAANHPAVDQPMQMSDRAILFANDINRLVGNHVVASPATTEAAAGSRIQNVLKRALALLGTPYRWGGTTTDGFDCSGLVGYVFRTTLGVELPRVSRDMARSGEVVDRASLSPGDLVFFGRRKGRVDHVGIYLGEGRFVHAPRTGRDVTVSTLEGGYWGSKFVQARRVAGI
jgi:cell wall-associated NlpC family hydrolase